jgi:hypothetical protein
VVRQTRTRHPGLDYRRDGEDFRAKITAAEVYPTGRPILLFGSLSSVMVTTVTTEATSLLITFALAVASVAGCVVAVTGGWWWLATLRPAREKPDQDSQDAPRTRRTTSEEALGSPRVPA